MNKLGKKYTLEDFDTIKFSKCNFKLNNDIIKIIQDIANKVGAPEYVKTPQFPKKDRYKKKMQEYNNNNNNNKDLTAADWKLIRDFKPTKIKKNEGIDAIMDRIRQNLNKISDKTYDILKKKIFNEINNVIDAESDSESNLISIGNCIFEIASTNLFYSSLYAKFYKDLLQEVSIMNEIFNKNFNNFNKLFDLIESGDPNKDYNKFCDINKENEKRRAIAQFYINLMKLNMLKSDEIILIINNIITKIKSKLTEKKNIDNVNELVELLNIFVVNGINNLKSSNNWQNIVDHITDMKTKSPKDYEGYSMKTLFKYMDMDDVIQNI